MKKFIIKSFLTGLPIFLLLISMEILVRKIPNDYSHKKEYLDKHSKDLEVLILGSSHAAYGLDPKFFSNNTFNAAHISQSLEYDLKIFYKYQSKLPHLKTVVIPISYFSLFYILQDGPEPWREKNYAIYYDIDGSANLAGHSEVASQRTELNLKRIFFYYVFNKSFMSSSNSGYGLRDYFPTDDLNKSGKIAAERHGITKGSDISLYVDTYSDKMKLLNKFISDCEKSNVDIIFFTPPAFKSYYTNLNAYQLNTTINSAKILDADNDNVKYFDFLKDPRFLSSDFHNGDHLSEAGAEKLSKIINSIIMEENHK